MKKVREVIYEHLVAITAQPDCLRMAEDMRMRWVKYLVLRYNDTSVEIDPDKIYKEFKKQKKD